MVIYPIGLLSKMVIVFSDDVILLPSNLISSAPNTWYAGFSSKEPFTVTLPPWTYLSACLLEHSPDLAMNLFRYFANLAIVIWVSLKQLSENLPKLLNFL